MPMGEIANGQHPVAAWEQDGEEVEIGDLTGAILPAVEFKEETIVFEGGDGTRVEYRREDVILNPDP
ncbi:MAG: hypothetical protein AAB650_01645 [Patescibacteria group bacterium]